MDIENALSQIKFAMKRLAGEYPFHAAIMEQWELVCDHAIQTMGVGYKDFHIQLHYNPDFVNEIEKIDALCGVLHHEINHILFEHLYHVPGENENAECMTIAQEVTVNEFVPENLPGEPVLLEQYPFLSRHQSTQERYEILVKRLPKKNKKKEDSNTSISGNQKGNTLDDHSLWDEFQKDTTSSRITIQSQVAKAIDKTVRELSDKELEDAVELLEEQLPGSFTDKIKERLDRDKLPGQLPWQQILRGYIGRYKQHQPLIGRPPRRFPSMAGMYPARTRYQKKLVILTCVDTSGSMSPKVLQEIFSELRSLGKSYEILIVEADVEIQRVYSISEIDEIVVGRGGTSFVPAFEPSFLAKYNPDVVIYFTDGYGDVPPLEPKTPVIWVITDGGVKPAPWGELVWMNPSSDSAKVAFLSRFFPQAVRVSFGN